ncbi:MAG: DUF1800 domain-containing protein [Bacteroidia bacterium]|nr:DUF1800 domain-containing protein [Bacteroidia bacterium]
MKPLLSDVLSPYTGVWGNLQAAHLLRRCIFGPTLDQIREVEALGMDASIDLLLADRPLPDPPINYLDADDPWVPLGESWVDTRYPPDGSGVRERRNALDAWILGQLLNQGLSLREKMTLFWHNHFPVERDVVLDGKFLYNYNNLLRKNALGNFKSLVEKITLDPAMLVYLNGKDNTKDNPNENYARELLELFTIGKGDFAGPGDYTTFTEEDVIAIAKVLTGWSGVERFSVDIDLVFSEFHSELHDNGTKRLSHRFDNIEISAAGENEYKNLIDLIFQKEEVAAFICRKIYRWFINSEINPTIESTVIQGMAQFLQAHDFEIKPLMSMLLRSKLFHDPAQHGAIIKNPMDFVFSVYNGLEVEMPDYIEGWYRAFRAMTHFMGLMQMSYFYPPSVAGWEAYYLQPQYYKQWINSATLRPRTEFTDKLSQNGFRFGAHLMRIDVLNYIEKFDNPADAASLINSLAEVMYPRPLKDFQVDQLKNVLIPGLPDFEWTIEYETYREEPSNEEIALSVENRLRNLFQAMLSLPEFHTS